MMRLLALLAEWLDRVDEGQAERDRLRADPVTRDAYRAGYVDGLAAGRWRP
jgi:hypothetical protein